MAHTERDDRPTEVGHGFAGYQAYDRHYEKIGKVDDLFVDESDRPEYIGVKTGLLGTKTTLIPIDLVRVNDKRQLVEVAADKETIKDGPTFGDDKEITHEFERRVLSHYGVETAQPPAYRGAYGAYYSDTTGDKRVDVRPGERVEAREHSGERHPGAPRGGVDRERGEFREPPASPEYEVVTERGRDTEDEDELRVQRIEEELRAGTREREAGGMRVRKRVRTDRERLTVPKKREEVRVERVPVEEGRGSSEAENEGDEIRVPVIEEEVVVERRPVVKEEIRIRKEVVEDEEVVEEDVRKEEIEIDDQTKRRNT